MAKHILVERGRWFFKGNVFFEKMEEIPYSSTVTHKKMCFIIKGSKEKHKAYEIFEYADL